MSAQHIEYLRRHLNSNEAFLTAKQENLAKIESTITYLRKIKEENEAFLQQIEYEVLKNGIDNRIDILEEWRILWNAANYNL